MRHYLLHFIKSYKFSEYKDTILDDFSSDATNQKIINNFLMKIGQYKLIPYMFVKVTKNDKKVYTFSSCGEATLLNLLNYYFINEKGEFIIPPTIGSKELKNFYFSYDTMNEQLVNAEKTITDWCEMVVSNLDDKDGNLYNTIDGDIHNNIKNINFVLKTILNSNENGIYDILNGISEEHKIEIIKKNDNEIEFELDEKYLVFFRPGHGDIRFKNEEESVKIFLNVMNEEEDFSILYNNIFMKINYDRNYTNEVSRIIVNLNGAILHKSIIKIFLLTITELSLNNKKLETLPNTIVDLINLQELHLHTNNLETIYI